MLKIQYVDGDLLDFPSEINVIATCCNCQAIFGAGIALQIKNRYPQAYQADKDYHALCIEDEKTQLGTYSAAVLDNGKIIINLYGQDGYGTATRQLNYEAIYRAMETVARNMAKNSHKQYALGFPYLMGCGLAGGDFSIVEAMIKVIFEPIANIQVIIVKYNK